MIEANKFIDANWILSVMELKDEKSNIYKVTKRLPASNLVETRIFDLKEDAVSQFEEWLKA